ncbi:MAG: homocysteine S-methyltransferase family protein [Bacteroidota bacterium]
MKPINPTQKHNFSQGFYLTDGGLETTMVFHYGVELPHFAAFELVTYPDGQKYLQKYFAPYLEMAQQYDMHFILDTPTWRANTDWGIKLGYSQEELDKLNCTAVQFMRELQARSSYADHILIDGVIGPRGDGYVATERMTIEKAMQYHRPQIQTFASEGVDIVTAMTITYTDEGIGIVKAAQQARVPVAISFTVETDGRLPSGETLSEAITKTDKFTDWYAKHFMINCAHPQHFEAILKNGGEWQQRIRGIRANASTKSHAELDESETLDTGDKCQLAEGYVQLRKALPDLRIIGGCCGTDHSHLEEICKHLFQ